MSVPEKGLFEKQLQVLWIIWAAMLGSLGIYVLICLLWGDALQRPASPFPIDLMRDILYGIAVLTVILTHFLRNFILGGRSGGSGPMSLQPPSPSDQSAVAGKYATAMIVSLALSESIGIYGLILFLLGDDLRTVFIFNGIAAIAMFFYRPKREELEANQSEWGQA
jgi:F0F1-type ATP synthase membrane subunit c/vacuolar-type H+-ATPase subunit K